MYDYADHAERICGANVVAIICGFFPDASYNSTVRRFRERFPLVLSPTPPARLNVKHDATGPAFSFADELAKVKAHYLYVQASGIWTKDERLRSRLRKLSQHVAVHAVFDARKSWGNSFAKISHSVRGSSAPVVPYMVRPLPDGQANLRASLGIPPSATVFCSYGGRSSFNIAFVRREVCELASLRNTSTWFLFANHEAFCGAGRQPGRVFFLPNLGTQSEKRTFVNTCDAMLHAREEGETFGLAVGEFSEANKPVLVWRETTKDRAHISILGNRAISYTERSLRSKLQHMDFKALSQQEWRAYGHYRPEKVIRTFASVFFHGASSGAGKVKGKLHGGGTRRNKTATFAQSARRPSPWRRNSTWRSNIYTRY